MNGFIECEKRSQSTLLPENLDEYVGEENSVRVVDVFVDSLDLLTNTSVAIDGSKFNVVNNRDKDSTNSKMERRLKIGRH